MFAANKNKYIYRTGPAVWSSNRWDAVLCLDGAMVLANAGQRARLECGLL